jgi:alkylation response protein AidB-like acyl-CoA dehydrogenase
MSHFSKIVTDALDRSNITDAAWGDPARHTTLQAELSRFLGGQGLLRTVAGYKYGSETEFDFRSALTFISTFARHSMPVTAAVCTSSRIGIHAVLHFGSEQMQRQYVDDCLGGRTVAVHERPGGGQ